MTTKQEDKLSMEIVVVDFLNNTDPSILALMPQINTLKEKFSNNVNKLRTFKNGQTLNRTGNRIAKDQLREQMTQLGFTTAAKVCAYAIAINNEVLEMEVTYGYSELSKLRDTNIADTCQSIHNIALANLTNLADYGVTTATLEELNNYITQYNTALPKTRAGIITQTLFTNGIAELFIENDKLLYRIDKLVTMLKFEQAAFHDEYFKSKKIINTGNRKLSLKGKITNELGKPIEKVTITIETPLQETAKSSEKGNYQFKGIETGMFPVTFKRDGYLPERVFLVFTKNTKTNFNIVLKQTQQQQSSA